MAGEPAGGVGAARGAMAMFAVAGLLVFVPSEAEKVKLSEPLYPAWGV